MLNLADTSIRLFRKKNGKVSVKLRSYLMIETDVSFRLGSYLRDISCTLALPEGEPIKFDDVSITETPEVDFQLNTLVHGFWASGITEMEEMESRVGKLRLNYLLSFTGHPSEGQNSVEYVVPIIRRWSAYGP